MKKVLLIGVSGFIGENLYDYLSPNYKVYGISRSNVTYDNCEQLDVSNKTELLNYFRNKNFDVVINLAAVLAKSNNLDDIEVLLDNLSITNNLVEGLKTYQDTHLINFSSSSVYANSSGNYNEQALIDPAENGDCIYGLSKFNSEILFRYLLKKYEINVTNLRVPMVYGEKMDKTRIHKTFERELEENNTISIWGNGERIISHISVNELVVKVDKIITNKIYGTYNLMGESISLIKLAERIIKKKEGGDSKVVLFDKGSKSKFVLDGTQLDKLLND